MKFVLVGEPVPKGRPRLNKKTGSIYTPKDTVAFEDSIAMMGMTQREKYGDSPVKVFAMFFTAKKKIDGDNCLKSVLDGLMKGGVFDDDSQVVEGHYVKVKSNNPRCEVTVEPTEELSEIE
jgi:Holliday junction resolvase RusA-like endonuclease